MTFDQQLAILVDHQWEDLQNRKIQRLLKQAAFKQQASIVNIDHASQRNLDHNINGSASAPMMGGKAVERGCDEHFLENRPLDLACDYAYQDFMNYEPRNWDDGSDKLKTDLVADEVFQVTNVAIEGLKEIFSGRNEEIVAQTHFLDYVDGLDLKYYTIPDYINCVDLKTKWSKPSQRTNQTRHSLS